MSTSLTRSALALFASCIKSGEAWSPECELAMSRAKAELDMADEQIAAIEGLRRMIEERNAAIEERRGRMASGQAGEAD